MDPIKSVGILFLLLFTSLAFATEEWELIEKQEKLELYTSKKSINGVYPYKARTWMPYTIPEIIAVFLDNKNKTDWIPRLKVSWAEEDPSIPGTRVEYGEILVPWPFSNRDVLVRIETQVIDSIDKVRLLAYSVQNDRVIRERNVRAIVHPSDLIMVWDSEKKETLLETISFTDPQGYIPKWIVNLFQKGEAINLTKSLHKQLKKKLYSKEQLDQIKKGLRIILKKGQKR